MNKKSTIEKIKKNFFNSDIIRLNPHESHGFYDQTINIGFGLTDFHSIEEVEENDLNDDHIENLLHEMSHLLVETSTACFSETNWGYGQRTVDSKKILELTIEKEARIMNYTYRLLEYYKVDNWNMSEVDYADIMTNGLIKTLKDYFKNSHPDNLDEIVFDAILDDLRNYCPTIEAIKKIWNKKIKLLEEERNY